MPRLLGPKLKEHELVDFVEPSDLRQAKAGLEAGRVVERMIYLNGAIQARWSADSDADLSIMADSVGELLVECTCAKFQDGGDCVHIAALALAWIRAPNTFTKVDREYTVDEFFTEHIGDADADIVFDDFDDEETTDPDLAAEAGLDDLRGEIQSQLYVPPELRLSPSLELEPIDLTDDYSEALDAVTLPDLRQIAQRRGIALPAGKREALVVHLSAALGHPKAVAAAIAQLSPSARLILALLPFTARLGHAEFYNLQGLVSSLSVSPAPNLRQGLTELVEAGLLLLSHPGNYSFPARLYLYTLAEPRLVRPLANAARLRVVASAPLGFVELVGRLLFTLRTTPSAARPPKSPGPAALVSLLAGWPFDAREVDTLAQKSATSSRALYSARLTVPPLEPLLTDAARAELARQVEVNLAELDFAVMLLASIKLITRSPEGQVELDDNTFLQYISQHPVQAVRPFFTAWMLLGHWVELDRAITQQAGARLRRDLGQTFGLSAAQLSSALAASRAGLLNYLHLMPAGIWIDLSAFVTQAHALNTYGALWRLPQGVNLEVNGRALLPQPLSDWAKSYGPWVEAVLTGPLFWLGLVDLGYDHDRLVAFRLTELGAFLTLKTQTFTAPELTAAGGRNLIFAGDGTLRLKLAAADPQLLSLLATLGDLRAGPGGALICTPTAAGALLAFQSGWEAERIIAALEQAAGRPVPEALARQWREWWQRLGELQVYGGLALLELGDDFVFDELMANTALPRYLLYRFGPRLAALRQADAEALRAELVEKGYTPKVVAGFAPATKGGS